MRPALSVFVSANHKISVMSQVHVPLECVGRSHPIVLPKNSVYNILFCVYVGRGRGTVPAQVRIIDLHCSQIKKRQGGEGICWSSA